MKTIIIYESEHHKNTKKLVDAIKRKYDIETVKVAEACSIDLGNYDVIGLASGIAFGKFYQNLEQFAQKHLPHSKKVFFLYTCGRDSGKYTASISKTASSRQCEILGSYGCPGFDTYGPFKLVGGISKGHPTQDEIDGAVRFYETHILH
ncbi:hypothetical protein C808_02251 [Lachnospiraceae bacterium M18-1]|nr:hypothetical protein C808_02251 [Lachnospiraceae bacterium M18-1]